MRRWIVWADEGEVARLQQFSQRSLADEARQRWTVPADNRQADTTMMRGATLSTAQESV
jgi:hypothetical protein